MIIVFIYLIIYQKIMGWKTPNRLDFRSFWTKS